MNSGLVFIIAGFYYITETCYLNMIYRYRKIVKCIVMFKMEQNYEKTQLILC
jgi:hypothetical protein